MSATASEIIALAQHTKALSKEQLARILEVAPKMSPADLEQLKAMILTVRESEMKDMRQELDLYKKVASAHQEWKADKARSALQTQEGAVQKEDTAQAEALIQNI